MALIPFEPFRQLDSIREEMNRWMNHNFPSWAQQTFSFGPRVDVSQNDREVIVEAEIPGLTKDDDLDINVQSNQVMLSGEIRRSRKSKPSQLTGETNEASTKNNGEEQTDLERTDYYHTERYVGQFQRIIPLPAEVDETGATAEYANGVLEIRIPKIQTDKGKRIDVRFQ